jgi:hypothetical protein
MQVDGRRQSKITSMPERMRGAACLLLPLIRSRGDAAGSERERATRRNRRRN